MAITATITVESSPTTSISSSSSSNTPTPTVCTYHASKSLFCIPPATTTNPPCIPNGSIQSHTSSSSNSSSSSPFESPSPSSHTTVSPVTKMDAFNRELKMFEDGGDAAAEIEAGTPNGLHRHNPMLSAHAIDYLTGDQHCVSSVSPTSASAHVQAATPRSVNSAQHNRHGHRSPLTTTSTPTVVNTHSTSSSSTKTDTIPSSLSSRSNTTQSTQSKSKSKSNAKQSRNVLNERIDNQYTPVSPLRPLSIPDEHDRYVHVHPFGAQSHSTPPRQDTRQRPPSLASHSSPPPPSPLSPDSHRHKHKSKDKHKSKHKRDPRGEVRRSEPKRSSDKHAHKHRSSKHSKRTSSSSSSSSSYSDSDGELSKTKVRDKIKRISIRVPDDPNGLFKHWKRTKSRSTPMP
eukprot:CAMPEP_0202728388 /NCGR_PEP_ID=MMETSP1385-20130828/185601_1 /ASSEMBLY_ACC=CAM_ASM_000861 /TAXON_ID=933848 /ORGANISM="Elphidium margaritaceum" /LENGTH=401 /DNA_ID=CAMNT_0049394635 /DNA_START=455 /DNA_END=1655 /DNA_ORIENTATION=+